MILLALTNACLPLGPVDLVVGSETGDGTPEPTPEPTAETAETGSPTDTIDTSSSANPTGDTGTTTAPERAIASVSVTCSELTDFVTFEVITNVEPNYVHVFQDHTARVDFSTVFPINADQHDAFSIVPTPGDDTWTSTLVLQQNGPSAGFGTHDMFRNQSTDFRCDPFYWKPTVSLMVRVYDKALDRLDCTVFGHNPNLVFASSRQAPLRELDPETIDPAAPDLDVARCPVVPYEFVL